jgi:hypothetical protein
MLVISVLTSPMPVPFWAKPLSPFGLFKITTIQMEVHLRSP